MIDVRIPDLRRLEKEVIAYESQRPETGKIVFYGDSSFTRWSTRYGMKPLEESIRGKDGSSVAVNRGFGTSTAEEQLYYYPRMIKPLKPRAVIVQAFGNDRDLNYSPSEILYLQSRLFEYLRYDFPDAKLYVCDVRPLIKNATGKGTDYYARIEYNGMLDDYCRRHPDVTPVRHAASPMFFDGPENTGDYLKVRGDIFIEDRVHYNQAGYDLYTEFFKEILDDLL